MAIEKVILVNSIFAFNLFQRFFVPALKSTFLLIIIAILNSCSSKNENIQKELIEDKISLESLDQFIPKDYSILDSTSGNLNLDDINDLILILKKDNEEETSEVVDNPEKRPLLILLGVVDGSYKLAAQSNNTVYCVDCGGMMGDPYVTIVIKNGYFSIEHYGGSAWRWSRIISYKYSKEDQHWFLHRDGGESFHASKPEESETKMITKKDFGKVRFEEFNIYEYNE